MTTHTLRLARTRHAEDRRARAAEAFAAYPDRRVQARRNEDVTAKLVNWMARFDAARFA